MPQANIEMPDLALPEGGGAPRGLDASVPAPGFRGSARLTIPLETPRARGGGPALALAYESGAGNGPYGAGATIALPMIGRSTALGVPSYTEADTIAFSEAGPLVEKGSWSGGRWIPAERIVTDAKGETWLVREYLPRLQAGFPLVERWTRLDDRIPHWRVLSADNVESRFGVSAEARVADPGNASRIFEWLIEEVADAKGNRIRYRYKAEDDAGVNPRPGSATNRYVERILYGNYAGPDGDDFAFEIVFDYGEYDLEGLSAPGSNPYVPVRPWPAREDCFSSYRAGFDLRTNRLCRAVLAFNRFPAELGAEPCLTAATRLDYAESPYISCLAAITRVGYRRGIQGGYAVQPLPPVALGFTSFDPPAAPQFRRLEVEHQASFPGYLMPGAYQPVDLNGEGIPGFLQSNGAVTYYYAPLGGGRYAAARAPEAFPDCSNLANPRLALTDIDGDGRVELLVTAETGSGFFRHRDDGGWGGFEPLDRLPTTEESPSSEFVDLNGDGLADVMTLSRTAVRFYPSLGEAGFAPAQAAERPPGFPSAAANSATERVAFADMFGDGLAHRVRVTDGQVAVWPNLGHGRFGDRLLLADAPDFAGAFPAARCYFADVDGTGAADLVVAASDRLLVYRNRCGNGFSAALVVPLPFRLTNNDQLSFIDILGNGTTAIVATRASPTVEHWFCDLAAPAGETGSKPYLLAEARNGFGATTTIRYRSSADFYLADKREGRRWPTRLPFPIQLVETLTVTDGVTGACEAQRFRYHDGYYDGRARAFRGFGYIESWAEQRYAPFAPAPAWPVTRVNADLLVTPGYTRSWYATGAYFQSSAIARQYAGDYYRGHPPEPQLPANAFDPAVLAAGGATLRQAYAALAGRPTRTEHYADEGAAQASATPYVVTAANYEVRLVQPIGPQGTASLMVRDREAITYRYERVGGNPRIEHSFQLASTVLQPSNDSYYERQCTICYGRRPGAAAPAYPEQQAIKARIEESWSTFVTAPFRMIGVAYAQRALDVDGLAPPAGGIYSFAEIEPQIAAALAAEIPYGQPFAGGAPQSRPTRHLQRYFWNDAQTAALDLGAITARALLHHERNAVFSQPWRAGVFGAKLGDADLTGLAGLIEDQGYWWNPGLIQSYFPPDQPGRFFLPSGTDSPSQTPGLFARSTMRYDAPYALLPVEVVHYADPATPVASAARYDYQALQPSAITDANGIVRQALYHPLGLVLATSIFKPEDGADPRVGDGDLADYVVKPCATFAAVLADPPAYLQQAGVYYYYDLFAWSGPAAQPAASISLARTRFVSDGVIDAPIEIAIDFADGLGCAAERKQACEPETEGGAERWLTSGRTVYDAQGQSAQAYFPFYTADPRYAPQQALADGELVAPPRIETRDPMGRVVRVATSKGFVTRTVHRAWETVHYDEDDTILDAPFYIDFMATYPAQPTRVQRDERAALEKAVPFHNTPSTEILDNAGHVIRQIRCNLGNIPSDHFAAIVSPPVTSAELWSALIAAGYLETNAAPQGTWVTAAFEPYTPGFALVLPPPYDQYAAPAAALLVQSCLTTLLVVDPAGRLLQAIDPRLFLAEAQDGAAHHSARFAYPMATQAAALSDSADAGPRWQLVSGLGPVVLSFDAMGRRQQQRYDGLQRLLTTIVTEPGGASTTTQALTYGEGQAGAAAANLIGEIWRIEDEAGVLQYPAYTILGQAVQAIRTFAADYKLAPDWSQTVALDPQAFPTGFTYDAMRRVLTETPPDTSVIARAYWLSGRLRSIQVTLPGGDARPFVGVIAYAADSSRTTIAFGNQVVQSLGYEATTGRLLAIAAQRPPAEMRDPTLQAVAYTYDPVGNVSIVRDRTAQLLFCGGTEPEALGDYGYDALYQLVSATGLQHPGIAADTHVTGFMQSLYAELCPPTGPPIALEPYAETYSTDLSGNLVAMHHAAASASFDRACPVEPDSNRLAGTPYDANGNVLATELTAAVPLVWSSRNLLARTGPFDRPDGSYDREYNVYDFFGQRVRRAVEHAPTATAPADATDERFVVGAYLLERATVAATDATTSSSALRIVDGAACMAVADTLSGGTPEVRYQLDDRLGSISIETRQDAGILSYEVYYPFGGTAIVAGSDPAVVARKLLRYSGKRCDENTGFYDFGARYYLPWQARWLNADPSGTVDGLNLFRFVRGNPATLTDPDGRNPVEPDANGHPPIPGLPPGFLINVGKAALYSVVFAPQHAFYFAPISIMRRISGSESERANARDAALARREESKLIFFNLSRALGYDPEKYLLSGILPYVRPQTRPWSTVNIPFYGNPLQQSLRSTVVNQDYLASTVGSFAGSFLTVGGTLAIARSLALRPTPGLMGAVKAGIAAGAISFTLTSIGQGEESDRVYANHQAEQAKLWFWSRSYMPGISGIPRKLVYTEHTERRTASLWNDHTAAALFFLAAGALLYRFAGPKAGTAARDWWTRPKPSTALVLRPSNLPAVISRPTATQLMRLLEQSSALVLYEEPARSLVPFARQNNLPAVIQPRSTTVQRYRPPPTAVQLYRPLNNALQLYRPPVTALVPIGLPKTAIPRAGLFGMIAATTVVAASALYAQQKRNSKTGTE